MEKIPKIVLQRLKHGAAGASPEGAPAPPGSDARAVHPDTNLLTAFVEKKLTDRERASVLKHLTNCVECREVAALAYPPTAEEIQPVGAEGRKPAWLTLPVVRWGAVATALGAILLTVILYRLMPQKVHETTVAETKQAPAPAQSAAQIKPEAVAPPAKETQGETLRQRAPSKSEARSTTANLNQPEAKQTGAAGGVAATAGPAGTSSTQAALTKPEPSAGYNSVGGALRSTAPASTGVLGPEQAGATTKTASAEMARAGTRPAEVATDKSEPASASRKDADLAEVQQAQAAPSAAPAHRAPAPLEAGSGLQSPPVGRKAKAPLASVHWSISATGKVERSADGGKTWEELHINDSLAFRVVAAAGSEVWAGGARGALYHSSDGGEHWVRVNLNPDGTSPADAIVGISFSDPLHGTVTTVADERWTTSDGGWHWTKQ